MRGPGGAARARAASASSSAAQLLDQELRREPPAAEPFDVGVHPRRRQLVVGLGPAGRDELVEGASGTAGDRRASAPRRSRRHRSSRRGRGPAVGRARRAPTRSNAGRPTGSTTAGVCCAATRGLRKSHSVTSARSSWSLVGSTCVESAVVSFAMISMVANTSSVAQRRHAGRSASGNAVTRWPPRLSTARMLPARISSARTAHGHSPRNAVRLRPAGRPRVRTSRRAARPAARWPRAGSRTRGGTTRHPAGSSNRSRSSAPRPATAVTLALAAIVTPVPVSIATRPARRTAASSSREVGLGPTSASPRPLLERRTARPRPPARRRPTRPVREHVAIGTVAQHLADQEREHGIVGARPGREVMRWRAARSRCGGDRRPTPRRACAQRPDARPPDRASRRCGRATPPGCSRRR